jgi:hypothetical protein
MECDVKEEMIHIRSKLRDLDTDRIELASICGKRGSEWQGTDAGFALGRFLDYAGSICNSPPPSLNASPQLFASDSGTFNTPMEIPLQQTMSTNEHESMSPREQKQYSEAELRRR